MPEIQSPPIVPNVDLEQEIAFFDGWSENDYAALKIVRETMERYEAARYTNCESKWAQNVRLYLGIVPERKWKGSNIPRATLSSRIVFDQVESAYPVITEALFENYPAFFDTVNADDPAAAAAYRQRLFTFLTKQYLPDEAPGIAQFKMAIHQALIYDLGAVELGWDAEFERPFVEFCDIRELFWDPLACGPMIDTSPAVIRRRLMTVEEVAALRGVPGIKVPEDSVLRYLSQGYVGTQTDKLFQLIAAYKGEKISQGDFRLDPRFRMIEVLQYWTKKRSIWVFNRLWTALNEPNPFGFLPFAVGTPKPFAGRINGLSLPESLKDDQAYASGIKCSRLDHLALILNRPRKKVGDAPTGPKEEELWPGKVERVQSMEHLELLDMPSDATQQAFMEESLIESRAARRFGINEMTMSGVPTPSNANRTAGGVARQSAAVGTRMKGPVEAFETFFILPTLYKIHEIMRKNGEDIPAGLQFRIDAASRMVSRERLAVMIGPVAQHVFNPQVIAEAGKVGVSFDFNEWNRFFHDATGTAEVYKFFRPATEEEQQLRQQPSPELTGDLQKAQLEAQTRLQMGQMKARTEIATTGMKVRASAEETSEKSARDILKLLGPKEVAKAEGDKKKKKPKE